MNYETLGKISLLAPVPGRAEGDVALTYARLLRHCATSFLVSIIAAIQHPGLGLGVKTVNDDSVYACVYMEEPRGEKRFRGALLNQTSCHKFEVISFAFVGFCVCVCAWVCILVPVFLHQNA